MELEGSMAEFWEIAGFFLSMLVLFGGMFAFALCLTLIVRSVSAWQALNH